MASTARRELLYGLEGVYLNAYDAVVRPHRVFAVRTYTLRRWAPMLGATGFWLLVALQQQCYRNPRGDDWCVVSRPDLAKAAGMSEATVHRYLHGAKYVRSWLRHWVRVPDPETVRRRPRRWSARAGRMVQPPNRYAVVMDAPLAPVDQRGLAQFLSERGVEPGAPAVQAQPALEHLAGLSLADLLDLCSELAPRFVPPSSRDEGEFYPTVADVLIALGVVLPADEEERVRFLGLCGRVQQAFVGQTYLGTHYFLRRWVPLLGHKLALVVVQLRSCCFWDAEERRDTVTMNFTHLAGMCGCSARWLRGINATKPESRLFFLVDSAGRGSPPVFRVTLLEPVAPQDRDRYERLLDSGEGTTEKGTGERGKGTDELLTPDLRRQNGTGELLRTEPVNTQKGTGELLRTEPVNTQNGTGEQHVNTIITIMNTSRGLKEQQHPRAPAAAAVALLLADFGIGSPADRRILSRQTDEDDVRAWMLYTLTQKGLETPDVACGYVVNRLLAGDRPPPRFRDWARLTASQWHDLWRAVRYGRAYVTALPPDLAPALEAWARDFGDVFPNGPFGDDGVDRDLVCDVVAGVGGDPTRFAVTVYDDAICLRPVDEEARRWLEERSVPLSEALAEKGILHRLTVPGPEETELSEAGRVWHQALGLMQLEMTRSTFNAWLRDSRLVQLEDGRCVVEVRSEYGREWLEHRLRPVVERALERVVGRPVAVEFVSPGSGFSGEQGTLPVRQRRVA